MASILLTEISKKFFKGVKSHAAKGLDIKPTRLQNFVSGRPVKDWMIVHIRRKYGVKSKRSGLTDTQILDLLDKEYPEELLIRLLNERN